MDNVSVGDFAASLLAQEQEKGVVTKGEPSQLVEFTETPRSFYSSNVVEQAPDISKVVVPTDFVSRICESNEEDSSCAVVEEHTPVASEIAEDESILEVVDIQNLMNEIKDLLVEVRQTLVEITAVGGLGVGPRKTKKSKSETDLAKMLKRIKQKK